MGSKQCQPKAGSWAVRITAIGRGLLRGGIGSAASDVLVAIKACIGDIIPNNGLLIEIGVEIAFQLSERFA